MSQAASRWKVDEHVRFRRLFDEGVVIHQDQVEALVLNDTALRFLELCDGKRSVDDIIAQMVGEFEVEESELSSDLQRLIAELEQGGIIVPVRESGK
ncbi:MAG: PqqD family protein [Xanthomonadales bacterium]|nr:PqqD family protein [Xanthomonadales bacterium]